MAIPIPVIIVGGGLGAYILKQMWPSISAAKAAKTAAAPKTPIGPGTTTPKAAAPVTGGSGATANTAAAAANVVKAIDSEVSAISAEYAQMGTQWGDVDPSSSSEWFTTWSNFLQSYDLMKLNPSGNAQNLAQAQTQVKQLQSQLDAAKATIANQTITVPVMSVTSDDSTSTSSTDNGGVLSMVEDVSSFLGEW